MFTDMLEKKVFKAAVSLLMEKHHNGNHFALGHFSGPVASFFPGTVINAVFIKNLVQFYTKIVDKTKKFRNLSVETISR
jgi:hypothetical protein